MSRLFATGFELNSTTTGVEGDTYSSIVIGTTNVRSGTYALRANTGGGFWRTQVLASDSATAIGYIRFYLYIATLPSANTQIFRLATSANTPEIDINLTTTGQLQLLNGLAVQIGSNSSTLSTGTWYRIEVSHDPGLGADTAYINGTSFASGTGTIGLWSRVLLGSINGTPTLDLYFDDVAINDNSGSFQNGLPGDSKLLYLLPNANGDNTGLTTGISDNTNHYVNVNEVTPNDDTSYNQTSTASQIDDYNLANSGIGVSDTVNVVSVGVRYRKVTSGTMVFNVRAKGSSGGTVEAGSNISSVSTTFVTNSEAVPHNYPLTMYDMPGASTTPWTQTDLDAAQIGVATVSNTASNWRVTKIWMLVDYTPNTGTNYTHNESDSVTTSDTIAKNLVLNRSDSVTSSDSFSRIATFVRSYSDSVTSSDSIIKKPVKNLSDSVTTSDGATQSLGKNQSLSDSVTSSDAIITKAVGKAVSDSISSSDSNSKSVVKNVLDTVTMSEAIIKKPVKILGDTISTSDARSSTLSWIRNFSDTVTTNDVRIAQFVKNLSDVIMTSDIASPSLGGGGIVTPSDTVITSDAIRFIVVHNVSDSISSSDVATKSPTKNLSDSVTATEAAIRKPSLGRADSVSPSDTSIRKPVKHFDDTITPFDSFSRSFHKTITDSVSISDSVTKMFRKILSDTVVTSDSFSYTNIVITHLQLTDLVNALDLFRLYLNGENIIAPRTPHKPPQVDMIIPRMVVNIERIRPELNTTSRMPLLDVKIHVAPPSSMMDGPLCDDPVALCDDPNVLTGVYIDSLEPQAIAIVRNDIIGIGV